MIAAKTDLYFKIPSFDVSNELLVIGKKIIIPLIQGGIDKGVNIHGSAHPPLEPSTIARKGHSKALYDTGTLYDAFQAKGEGYNKVVVSIKPTKDRNKIGYYLQEEGIRSKRGLKFFKFFGVTQGMGKDAMGYMNNVINRRIKNA